MECFEVAGFVIGFTVLPAAEEDALPFVGETAQDGLVPVALGFLLLIIGFGPQGLDDGLCGPFDKGLPPELVAGVTAVDEMHLAALFGERGYSALFLDGGGTLVFSAVAAEEGKQAGGEGGTGSGKGFEDGGILMLGGVLFDFGIEVQEAGLHGGDLTDQGEDEFDIDGEDGFFGAEGNGVLDELNARFDDFGAAAAMSIVELGDGGGFGFLKRLEGGPFGQEGAGERCVEIAAGEFEGLGETVFEGLGESIGEAGADADELAAFFGEQGDLIGKWIDGNPGLKPGVALEDKKREGVGVAAVILGAGGAEGFAVFLDDGGVDEIEAEKGELAEEVDQVLTRLLNAEGNGVALWKGFFEFPDPGEQGLGGGADFGLDGCFARGVQRADVNGGIRAVNADVEVVFHGYLFFGVENTRACPGDGFIGMSLATTTEESLLNKPRSSGQTACSYS